MSRFTDFLKNRRYAILSGLSGLAAGAAAVFYGLGVLAIPWLILASAATAGVAAAFVPAIAKGLGRLFSWVRARFVARVHAARNGHTETVQALLQELNAIPGITLDQRLQALNQADVYDRTAINIAALRGNNHGTVAILKKAKDEAEYEQARALGVTFKRLPFAKDVVSVIIEYDLRASGSLEQEEAFWEGYDSINLFESPLPHEAQSQDDLSASSSVPSKGESLPSAVEESRANILKAYEDRNKKASKSTNKGSSSSIPKP